MKAACLWSGGKDSCFACHKAISEGHKIISLMNFTQPDGAFSLSHGLPAKIIKDQAGLAGIPILQKGMPWGGYEKEFKALIKDWKKEKGMEGLVFGDIYLQEHKDWIDRVCREAEIETIFPLWKLDTKKIIFDFIDSGFESIVVCVKHDILSNEWLGRKIDRNFIEELLKFNPRIDPCGEAGEFHSLVISGPLFNGRLSITSSQIEDHEGRGFLNIKGYKIINNISTGKVKEVSV
jgi:uncharacterized protein (TIGR00290 family)